MSGYTMPTPAAALEAVVRRDPRAVALSDAAGELTYGELWDAAVRLAHGLQDVGVAPGGRVGLAARPGRGWVVMLCTSYLLGADLVVFDPHTPTGRIEEALDFHEAGALIADAAVVDRLSAYGRRYFRVVIADAAAGPGRRTLAGVIGATDLLVGENRLPRPAVSRHVVCTGPVPKGVVCPPVDSRLGFKAGTTVRPGGTPAAARQAAVEALCAGATVVFDAPAQFDAAAAYAPPETGVVAVAGRVLPGCRVEVHAGEVYAAAPAVSPGYTHPALALTVRDGCVRTGDTGFFDADGTLTVTGRSSLDAEDLLMRDPRVAAARVDDVVHVDRVGELDVEDVRELLEPLGAAGREIVVR